MTRRHAGVLELLALVGTLAAAGWLRLDRLGTFIASDEVRWTCRSINFHSALDEHRWADTFQVGHPGVATMWLGAAALPLERTGDWRELCRTTEGGTDLTALDNENMTGVLQTIAPLLLRARLGIAVGTMALLLVVYALVRAAAGVGALPALTGLALLALGPFVAAHSRVLHLDAVTSLLALCSVVAVLSRPRGGRLAVLLSGVFAGLAIVNKSSALVLGLFVPLTLVCSSWRTREWRRAAEDFLVWVLSAGGAAFLVWPAMWVQPLDTVRGVLVKAAAEGGLPHESGNYFRGQPVEDPGPLFYPVAAAFRLTPWTTLALLAAAAVAGLRVAGHRGRRALAEIAGGDEAAARLVVGLLAWAVLFGVVLTFGPKKFDRYILPSLVAIEMAGGVALGLVASAIIRRKGAATLAAAALVVLVVLQAASSMRAHPYELAYYNALLGGARAAERAILVGWGEGYDLAADWLNSQPDADHLEVAVRGVANFAPLFRGRTRSAEGYRPGTTDYVVLYVSQVQRRQNPELLNTYGNAGFRGLDPAYIGWIDGLEYVRIYHNATWAPLVLELLGRLAPGDVVVAAGDTLFARRYSLDAPLVRYWGHWGEAEMSEAVTREFPSEWKRAWVVRYPGRDPEVPLDVLGGLAERHPTLKLADGQVEITRFTRSGE